MANVALNPDSTISNNWTIFGSESTVHEALADDTGVDSGVSRNQDERVFIVTLDDLDFSGLNIDSILSIQGIMEANNGTRNQTSVLTCDYIDDQNSTINSYSEDITVSTTGTNTEYTWTSRTTSDGSTAWSDSDIDDMRLKIVIKTAPSSGEVQVYKLLLRVTYSEAGYGNDVMGVVSTNISKINGIATANISKVNGV